MNTQNSDETSGPTPDEMRETALATRDAFLKHKWIMGILLGHDPLLDRSENELFAEWIGKHAAAFREYWEEQRRARCIQGKPRPNS